MRCSSPFPVRSRFNLRGRLLSGYLLCALLIVAVVAVGNRALTGLRSVWQDTAAAVATSLQEHGAAGCDVAALRQLASSAVDAADAQGVATALANCRQLAQTDRGNGITCAPALAAVRELLSVKDLQIRTRDEADACRTEFQQLLATLLHNREPSAADTRRDASVPWDSAVQQVQSAAQAGTQAVTETAQASAQELRAAQSTIESALAVADLLDAVQATVSQSVAAGDVAGEPAAAATLSSLLARIEQSLATSGNVADGENLKAATEPLPELTARVLEARRQVSAADRQLRERACTALCTATSLIAESLGAYTPHVYAAPEAAGDELPGTFSTAVADEQDELARAAQQQAVAVQALSSAQTELQTALQALDTKVQKIVHAAAARTAAAVNESLQQLQQRVAQSANRPLETLRQLAAAHQACAAREEQAVARSSAERLQSCQTAAARLLQAQQQAAGAEQDVRRAALAVDRQLADLDTRLAAQLQTLTDRLADTQQAAGALVRGRQIGLWSLTVCAVLAAAGAGFTTYRSVAPPIQRMVRLLQDVAEGEADLTRRLPDARGDELGEMARWFNRFLERVQRVIGQIRQDATTLANAAGELSGTANDLATGADAATRQSATVSGTSAQIASHMTAMSSSTQQMTANIKLIASAVAQMTSGIGEVAANAEQAASVAGNAARLADASNTTVGQLGQAAEEIEKVIETIQDIAEQINLLALNATIEAARAGSAGRGFAVVATEVKELAAQAAHATVDIRQRIERIQRSAHESVDSIGRIASVIRQVNDVSATIATAFEQQSTTVRAIARNVSETSAAAEQVAAGVDQSAAASQRITVSIAGVDEAARETAAGANHTQTAAGELTRMAQQLQTLVRQFSV